MSELEFKTNAFVDRLFLATDNPRHEEVDDQMEAIENLCRTEDVAALARDIARYGISPAERLIVYPVDEGTEIGDISRNTNFVVAEGNRRVCALKLLHDPDLAPASIREAIKKISDDWTPIDDVDVVVILDQERRRHWLQRIHDGVQGGRGRKPWNAEQRTRFSGSRRNIIAQQLFDYAEKKELMKAAQRRGSFSHMARLVGNVLVAEALGLDLSKGVEELHITRPVEEFDIILSATLKEAFEKNLGSQALKAKIDAFSRDLNALPGVTQDRIESYPLSEATESEDTPSTDDAEQGEKQDSSEREGPGEDATGRPGSKPISSKYIRHEQEIADGLQEIGEEKLQSLYYSITKISAETHTPLIAVGAWSFLESLAAAMGKNEGTSFKDYLSKGKLSQIGLGKGKELNAPSTAIGHIANNGNLTKHHSVGATFDYRQLINDMKTLTPLIVACIKEIKQNG